MKKFSFEGATVIITGGSRGLGLALAEENLKAGAKVCLLARNKAEWAKAESLLRGVIPKADILSVVCDVTKHEEISSSYKKIEERFNRIDVLINNAGAIPVGPFNCMEPKDFEAQMKLHFQAVFDTTTLILPFFRKAGNGGL